MAKGKTPTPKIKGYSEKRSQTGKIGGQAKSKTPIFGKPTQKPKPKQ